MPLAFQIWAHSLQFLLPIETEVVCILKFSFCLADYRGWYSCLRLIALVSIWTSDYLVIGSAKSQVFLWAQLN